LRNALGQNRNYGFQGEALLTIGRKSLVTTQIGEGQGKIIFVFVGTGFVELTVSQINPVDSRYVTSL
jgi:hypothetical protein